MNVKKRKTIFGFILGVLIGYDFSNHFIGHFPISCGVLRAFEKNSRNREENKTSGVLYIGIMSADKYLDTRIEAAMETWMKHLPPGVKVEVFADNEGTFDPNTGIRYRYLKNGFRVIQLPKVSDRFYPPQKKSFSLVKFMHDMYIDQYDWFLRLDDDAYLNPKRLENLLAGINSSKPIYMGHLALGLHEDDFLDENSSFCMGGPGMVFSKALLRKLAPHLHECLTHLLTEHEDVEVGRCIQNKTGQSCVTSWEAAETFFQDFDSKTGSIQNMKKIHFDEAATFHPNKDRSRQNLLHVVVLKKKIENIFKKIVELEKDEERFDRLIRQKRKIIDTQKQIWATYLGRTAYNIIGHMKAGLRPRFIEVYKSYAQAFQSKSIKEKKTIKAITNEVTHFYANPLRYASSISKLQVKYMYGPPKTHRIYITQKQYFPRNVQFFHEPRELEISSRFSESESFFSTVKSTAVNFLVILYQRKKIFLRFLNNFEETFLQNQENVNLIVVYFSRPGNRDNKKVKKMSAEEEKLRKAELALFQSKIKNLQSMYKQQTIKFVDMKDVSYCKTTGLQKAEEQVTNKDEILFFCDVDMIFDSPAFLWQVRQNTVQGKRTYYPVTFSEYDPSTVYKEIGIPNSHFEYREIDGFWRFYGFGMVAIYKSDFDRTRGFDLSICGWGQEDVELVNEILRSKLDIFQATVPGIVHVYHDKNCDSSIPEKRLTACKAVRSVHYGPATFLAKLYQKSQLDKLFLSN